jgi:hypothetical protein
VEGRSRAEATPRFVVYDGLALDHTVFRIVASCPPTLDDFKSYYELGRGFTSYQMFRATGVSMFLTEEDAGAANRKFRLGTGIAEVDLRDNRNMWSPTGSHGHITVWATPPVLLNRVVRCAEEGDD